MIDYSKVPKISWSVLSTYGTFEEATRLGEKMSDLGSKLNQAIELILVC